MKKSLIFIIALICSTNVCAQDSAELLTKVLNELDISKSEVAMSWATKQAISGMPDKSIVVIPKIAELKENAYVILDAYILLVDNHTGKIEAKFVENRAWTSDAYILYSIEIQPKPYNLNEETKAFSIILEYESDSRVNQFGSRELSLFIQKGQQLIRVLKNYLIISSKSETNGRCNGRYEVHSKNIVISDSFTNEYHNLKVIDHITVSKSTEENCEPQVISESKNIEILKFRNGKYQQSSN